MRKPIRFIKKTNLTNTIIRNTIYTLQGGTLKGPVLALLIFILLILFMPKDIKAIENPLDVPNNKFGIHIIDENDLAKAAELVNSSGGDWGYVTLVIREDERATDRWQEVFNKMRRLHLIPLVRVATIQTTEGWVKPRQEEIANWVSFFDSLNWVVKNRYIIIGNEPNQAHEWSGELKPDEYADYLFEFSKKLKEASDDYFVLPAGFDAAAPNSKTTMDEKKYLQEMLKSVPNVFENIDGWTSHSYPKAQTDLDFQIGQGTLRTYQWELDQLKKLGVIKPFPVFITETGWSHDVLPDEKIGEFYEKTFIDIWSDDRIVAVTPFLLNYKSEPFLKFSWLDPNGEPYSFYNDVKIFPKTKGEPVQISDSDIIGSVSTPIVQAGHGVYGLFIVENKGQSIWINSEINLTEGEIFSFEDIEPKARRVLFFKVFSPETGGVHEIDLQLQRKNKAFGKKAHIYPRVVKLPRIF